MDSNLFGETVNDILRAVIEDSPDVLLTVNPSADVVEKVIEVATEIDDDLPTIRMLVADGTLKSVFEDFIVASNAADLIDAGVLSLRVAETEPENSLLVTEDLVIALISAGDRIGGLSTDDDDFVDATYDAYTSAWEDAETYSLRTPPLSRVRSTLTDEISPEAETDFNEVLASLDTARGDGDGLDEVTISLLIAAKNEALLYDISKWGEDVGIASKATFSRTKTRLEDMGLIGTEKVPIDVGRPRLRLKLADDRLRTADADQLASVAQSILN